MSPSPHPTPADRPRASRLRRRLRTGGLLASALLVGTLLAPGHDSAPTTEARWQDSASTSVPALKLDTPALSLGASAPAVSIGGGPDWSYSTPVQNTSAATSLAWGVSSVKAAPRANTTQARASSLLGGVSTSVRMGGCTSSTGSLSMPGSAWSTGTLTPTSGAASKQGRATTAPGASSSLCMSLDHSASALDLYRAHAGTDLDLTSTVNGYSSPGTWTTPDRTLTQRLSVPVPRPTTPTSAASSMCKPQPSSGNRKGINWAWPAVGAVAGTDSTAPTFTVYARSRDDTTWRVAPTTYAQSGFPGAASYTYPNGTVNTFSSDSSGLKLADDSDWWEFKVVAFPYAGNTSSYVESTHAIRVVGRDGTYNLGYGFDECLAIPNDGASHAVTSTKFPGPISTTYNNGKDWTTLDTALVTR